MSQTADLYALLRTYAVRTKNAAFPVATFSGFLEKYTKRFAEERPELAYWSENTERRVSDGLQTLKTEGRCILVADDKGGLTVTIPQFFVDLLHQIYKTFDDTPELPFPDESTIKVPIPANLAMLFTLDSDLQKFISDEEELTTPIMKIALSDSAGTIFLLPTMVPRRILELSLLKARHYLRSHNNKDYVLHKLAPAFQGKESLLKDMINQLMVKPFDAMDTLEKAGDFSFPFWAYFTSLVKGDIRKKADQLPEDTAALQAMLIIEFLNNYYKGKTQKELQVETALKNLDLALDKAPWFFSMNDIIKFVDTKGIPLLGQYSSEELEEYLRAKTTSPSKEMLPELLIFHGPADERWFIRKTRLLPLVIRLLGETRPEIKSILTQRWFKFMSDFETEPAMEEEAAYEQELANLTSAAAPLLASILGSKFLYLVFEEVSGTEDSIPESSKLFLRSQLAPMSQLYLLTRKDLLTDVRMLLPVWRTIPLFASIVAFFRRLSQPKDKPHHKEHKSSAYAKPALSHEEGRMELGRAGGEQKSSADKKAQLKEAAKNIQKSLVPSDYSLDEYLDELRDKWNRNLNAQAKKNLNEDVNALIRDYLRKTAKTLRAATFTTERLTTLAATLANTAALEKLPNKEALRLYIQLYMVKLVLKS